MTCPLVEPDPFFLQGAPHSFGIRIAFRIVVTGTRLRAPQDPTSLRKDLAGQLTAIVNS